MVLLINVLDQFVKVWHAYPFDIIASFCALPVLAIYLLNRKIVNRLFLPIGIYAVVTVVFEIWNNSLGLQGFNNFITYYFFFIVEGLLLAWFYRDYFITKSSKTTMDIIHLLIVGIAVYGTINYFFIDKSVFNSSIALAEGLLLIVLSLSYLLDVFRNISDENLFKSPRFIISAGILLYFSGTFFALAFADVILKYKDLTDFDSWHIITALVIIFRLILAWGIWLTGKYER